MSQYYFTEISVDKLINNALRQRELVEARKKLDSLCREIGYRHVKTCNKCSEVAPEKLFSESREDYKKIKELLPSPPKVRERRMKKLLKEAYIGVAICSHYANGGWFRKRTEGLILLQEFYIKLADKVKDIEEIPNKPLSLSLGDINYCGYGNWDGKQEVIFDEWDCRNKLGVPEKPVIRTVNQTQIIERLKINSASLFQQV